MINIEEFSLVRTLADERKQEVINSLRREKVSLLADFVNKTEDEILEFLSKESSLKFLGDWELDRENLMLLPMRMIHEYLILPVKVDENSEKQISLVTNWLPNDVINRWVYAASGKLPKWFLTELESIEDTIEDVWGIGSQSLENSEYSEDDSVDLLEDENQDAAIIKFVNEVILKAIESRATDIHFEPQKRFLQIRYRIDGELVPIKLPENLVKFQAAIISRLKIMARLNISEKRRPQDGRIRFSTGGVELDIRLSSLSTMYGESLSLRLLNQGNQPISLTEIGLDEKSLKKIEGSIFKPHGIVLVTGPTGSGKSTTLSSFVRRIRVPERRIMTVEDPVEYEIEGVNQTQVQSDIGLTFASALRHLLRQDPDIIMIGEIRDRETADIAIRAALTGHLVLSSLHTNDAAGSITRLIDMGIEPFLVASSVEMIIAQRLVRRLCLSCAEPIEADVDKLKMYFSSLGLDFEKHKKDIPLIKEAKGCENCRYLGFKGRVGIFEILKMSDEIHNKIIEKESANAIREVAIREGMKPIQESAFGQVTRGLTSIDAIMRFVESGES